MEVWLRLVTNVFDEPARAHRQPPFGLLIKAQARFSEQSEGYNYVGLGILALILILVGGIAANPRFPRWPFSE